MSRYAWGDDYHEVIGRRLDRLLDWMRAEHGAPFEARAFVDTGPVHERAYAQRAGLGWIGKHGCVINPDLGSWLFLSEIVCSLPLAPDEPALDRCGACTLCLEACPTGAIVEPHVLDARRCLSYLTIELRRGIPNRSRGGVGSACLRLRHLPGGLPLEPGRRRSDDPAWQPRPALDRPRLVDLWDRSDEELASSCAARPCRGPASRPPPQPRRGARQQRAGRERVRDDLRDQSWPGSTARAWRPSRVARRRRPVRAWPPAPP